MQYALGWVTGMDARYELRKGDVTILFINKTLRERMFLHSCLVLEAVCEAKTPELRSRSYKAFSLENGLRVLLVEDSLVDWKAWLLRR